MENPEDQPTTSDYPFAAAYRLRKENATLELRVASLEKDVQRLRDDFLAHITGIQRMGPAAHQ